MKAARFGIGRRGKAGALLLGTLLAASAARADFLSVMGTATPAGVSQQQSTRVGLTWDIRVFFNGPPNSSVDQVGSTSLVVGIPSGGGCQPLETLQRTLQGSVQLSAQPPYDGAIRLTEQVEIRRALVVAARQQGANAVALCRTFQESLSPNTREARVLLPIRSGGIDSTDFALTYVRMRFDDGAVSRLVRTGTPLQVQAEVQYQGRGLLRAQWEVADPSTTRGEPLYRPLHSVHEYLSGDGRIVLRGPLLPTDLSGVHLVRLRILEPEIDAPGLVLRYFVQGGSNRLPSASAIRLKAPGPGVRLAPGDELAWEPVEGAAAYRLEFTTPGAGMDQAFAAPPAEEVKPEAGQLVPGEAGSAALSPMVFSRLSGGRGYWRVVALDESGRRIAASGWRPFLAGEGGSRGGP